MEFKNLSQLTQFQYHDYDIMFMIQKMKWKMTIQLGNCETHP